MDEFITGLIIGFLATFFTVVLVGGFSIAPYIDEKVQALKEICEISQLDHEHCYKYMTVTKRVYDIKEK